MSTDRMSDICFKELECEVYSQERSQGVQGGAAAPP